MTPPSPIDFVHCVYITRRQQRVHGKEPEKSQICKIEETACIVFVKTVTWRNDDVMRLMIKVKTCPPPPIIIIIIMISRSNHSTALSHWHITDSLTDTNSQCQWRWSIIIGRLCRKSYMLRASTNFLAGPTALMPITRPNWLRPRCTGSLQRYRAGSASRNTYMRPAVLAQNRIKYYFTCAPQRTECIAVVNIWC